MILLTVRVYLIAALLSDLYNCYPSLEDGEGTLSNKRLGCINLNHKIIETIAHTKIKQPSDLSGRWVSENCETRDGPQYLLRSYTFDGKGSMYLLQIYYSDDSCTNPIFSLTANGSYSVRSNGQSRSDTVKLTYDIFRVTITIHDQAAINDVVPKLQNSCPELYTFRWNLFFEVELFNKGKKPESADQNSVKRSNVTNNWPVPEDSIYYNERTVTDHSSPDNYQKCLSPLNITFNDLRFARVQIRPRDFKEPSSEERRELLFQSAYNGTLHKKKTLMLPFQLPLVLPEENMDCHVCQDLKSSRATHVPHLTLKIPMHFLLNGEWISTDCETKPPGHFYTMKHIRINAESKAWQTEYRVYSNNNCSHQLMTYWLTGRFTIPTVNSYVGVSSRAFPIDFEIEKATLMIKHSSIIDNIQHDSLCNAPGYWKVGALMELPSKYGCTSVGILTPSVRYDVAKIDVNYDGTPILFLGEQVEVSPPNLSPDDLDKYRPTSYQYTLIQCSEHPFHSSTNHNLHIPGTGHDHTDRASAQTLPYTYLVVFYSLFYFFYH